MKKINPKDFLIKPRKKIKIDELPTRYDLDADKEKIEDELRKVRRKIAKLQTKIYAAGTPAVYIGIQGMDTAGKDSMIREVFKDINPSGIFVYDFKKPTAEEHAHDYIWRHYKKMPERGMFVVHNRTHYEDVLIARIHPQLVLAQNIYGINSLKDITDKFWKQRFRQIKDFERLQTENGTVMIKLFLHLSKEEQKNRFLRRIRREDKQWKFNEADLKERKRWDEYMKAYEDVLNNTSTSYAPWYFVPADDKPTARLIAAKIIYDILKQLDVDFPKLSDEEKKKFEEYRQQLLNEKD
ncbi:MAG: polyphosphate kinase 2 family protein [Chlorobi bacterium]|nr:polyphosphate kinase 2 family protein [Chlorobiota bacterium]